MNSSTHKKTKGQAEKIAWITFFWILVSMSQFLRGYVTLNQFDVAEGVDLIAYFRGSVVIGLSAGLIGGTITVFFWENWLRTKAFGLSLLNIAWSFSLIFLVVGLISSLAFNLGQEGHTLFSEALWQTIWTQFASLGQLYIYLFWLSIVLLTLIGLSVNDKYGPGVFKSFILGRYFQPKREERIFMFLDLRGSTSIAEKIGEEKYFNFLKDVYKDVTPSILNAKGEIYQYVGDEIVISWKTNAGIKNANCLQCFFDIGKAIEDQETYYKEHYEGIVPKFKAGLHYGAAMVGEIGIVKRDIVFSGDVLNTAARIQSKCNEMGKDILLSADLIQILEPLPKAFKAIELGEMELRGKQSSLMLYTIQ